MDAGSCTDRDLPSSRGGAKVLLNLVYRYLSTYLFLSSSTSDFIAIIRPPASRCFSSLPTSSMHAIPHCYEFPLISTMII